MPMCIVQSEHIQLEQKPLENYDCVFLCVCVSCADVRICVCECAVHCVLGRYQW